MKLLPSKMDRQCVEASNNRLLHEILKPLPAKIEAASR
jgi:hypothetical protein